MLRHMSLLVLSLRSHLISLWTCSVCYKENSSTSAVCSTCAESRFEFWQCRSCLTVNPMIQTVCFQCKAQVNSKCCRVEKSHSSRFAQKDSMVNWKCSICGAGNAPGRMLCVGCDALWNDSCQPFATPPSSWRCSTCRTIRPLDQVDCTKCKKMRPRRNIDIDFVELDTSIRGAPDPQPGAWHCVSCNTWTRETAFPCRICKTVFQTDIHLVVSGPLLVGLHPCTLQYAECREGGEDQCPLRSVAADICVMWLLEKCSVTNCKWRHEADPNVLLNRGRMVTCSRHGRTRNAEGCTQNGQTKQWFCREEQPCNDSGICIVHKKLRDLFNLELDRTGSFYSCKPTATCEMQRIRTSKVCSLHNKLRPAIKLNQRRLSADGTLIWECLPGANACSVSDSDPSRDRVACERVKRTRRMRKGDEERQYCAVHGERRPVAMMTYNPILKAFVCQASKKCKKIRTLMKQDGRLVGL